MMEIGIPLVALIVFLHMCWQSFKRDVLGVKTFYTWEELEARDAEAARKKAEKKARKR